MKKRTLLVTATLTALVLSVGALQATPVEGAAEPAAPTPISAEGTPQAVETPAGPQWGHAFGLGTPFSIASTLVCAFFSVAGAIACGLAGAA